MLSTQQQTQLARLANGPTRYEAVLTLADGSRFLVGYCTRHSKIGLLAALRRVGPAILAKMPGLPDDDTMKWEKGCFRFTSGAKIAFSGRTQRDAIMCGALTFVEG